MRPFGNAFQPTIGEKIKHIFCFFVKLIFLHEFYNIIVICIFILRLNPANDSPQSFLLDRKLSVSSVRTDFIVKSKIQF